VTRRPLLALSVVALSAAAPAHAFPHVVKQGETLAQIAERTYGQVEMERVLVSANGLDAGGGIAIVRGMRLDIPAPIYHRVAGGDTWASLAGELLGDPDRADVLAAANSAEPWVVPADGAEIVVPYNLRVVAGPNDSLITIAQRFVGKKEAAWVLDKYNHQKGKPLHKGDVVLVPITPKLTEDGKIRAAEAAAFERSQGGGGARETQKKVDGEIPALLSAVRGGRYVDAVVHGAHVLSMGSLTKPQAATVHRQMLEAYVALDAKGHASAACRAWREADDNVALDPTYLSPKILAACDASLLSPRR
jgi:LysM repeat protein